MRLKKWTVNIWHDLTSVFCSKSLHVKMVTLLCMPEARLPMLCANYSHTYNLCFACHAAGYNAWIHRFMHAVKSLCARHVSVYNPWGSIVCAEQSMDCLDPYFAHGTIHGLRAQSTDYCAICGSIDCAGQSIMSMDCPNPYFAHNIYRIVLNSGPGVYFLPEVLDPALIRDRRLIETGVK